jgi:hypothetical protein
MGGCLLQKVVAAVIWGRVLWVGFKCMKQCMWQRGQNIAGITAFVHVHATYLTCMLHDSQPASSCRGSCYHLLYNNLSCSDT